MEGWPDKNKPAAQAAGADPFQSQSTNAILKRAICSDEEWIEYEEKVNSEMDLSELLEDLGKVLEAANRINKKKT